MLLDEKLQPTGKIIKRVSSTKDLPFRAYYLDSGNRIIMSERLAQQIGCENKLDSIAILSHNIRMLICNRFYSDAVKIINHVGEMGVSQDDLNFLTCGNINDDDFLNWIQND